MERSYLCFSLEVGEKEKNLSVNHNSSNKLLVGDIHTQNIKYLGNVDITVHLRIITIAL